MTFNRQAAQPRPRKAEPDLPCQRAGFILSNGSYAAEHNPLPGLSHGAAARLRRKLSMLGITKESIGSISPLELELELKLNSIAAVVKGKVRFMRKLEPDLPAPCTLCLISRQHCPGSTAGKRSS
jgi:hypothetical protein